MSGLFRDLVSALADILLTVDLAFTAAGLLAELQRPHQGRARLLRAHVEVLAGDSGNDLQVLDEVVRLVL